MCRKLELIYSSSFSATGSVLYPASTKNPKLWQLSEPQSSALAQISLTTGLFMHKIWGAGMAQWWERSPPTNVSRVRFPDPASYVSWVYCWFSSLLRDNFLRVLRFSSLLKNQHFQIPIPSGLLSSTLSRASGSSDRASTPCVCH